MHFKNFLFLLSFLASCLAVGMTSASSCSFHDDGVDVTILLKKQRKQNEFLTTASRISWNWPRLYIYTYLSNIQLVQNRAMRIILKVEWKTCTHEMRNELKLLTLLNRRRFFRFVLIFKILNNLDCP